MKTFSTPVTIIVHEISLKFLALGYHQDGKIFQWASLRKNFPLGQFTEKYSIGPVCGKIFHLASLQKNIPFGQFTEKYSIWLVYIFLNATSSE